MLLLILKTSITILILAIGMIATKNEIIYLWRRPTLLLKSIIAIYVLMVDDKTPRSGANVRPAVRSTMLWRVNRTELLISCKKSRYLMIPNQCDTNNLSITQFQYFNENLVIS
jgi:hypothetical protein